MVNTEVFVKNIKQINTCINKVEIPGVYLTIRPSSDYNCVDIVVGAHFQDACGYTFNLNGLDDLIEILQEVKMALEENAK